MRDKRFDLHLHFDEPVVSGPGCWWIGHPHRPCGVPARRIPDIGFLHRAFELPHKRRPQDLINLGQEGLYKGFASYGRVKGRDLFGGYRRFGLRRFAGMGPRLYGRAMDLLHKGRPQDLINFGQEGLYKGFAMYGRLKGHDFFNGYPSFHLHGR